MFLLLNNFLEDNDLELPMSTITIISDHLITLKSHFVKYFSNEIQQYNWIEEPNLTIEAEQLIDIPFDSSLRMIFSSLSFLELWNNIQDEYLEVSNNVSRIIIPFATSYLNEAAFSAVASLKSK